MRNRRAGILMHISSLPGRWGIGDLGREAARFADVISDMGMRAWQFLPIGPTDPASAHSPYSSPSSYAGNFLFISPDGLVDMGLLSEEDVKKFEVRRTGCVDYDEVWDIKTKLVTTAYENFRRDGAYESKYKKISDDFWDFCVAEAWWLEDYALYSALKELEDGAPWYEWRDEFRKRDWSVLDPLKETPEIAKRLDFRRFEQFIFFTQLDALKRECAARDVELIGDLPIYVASDSSDVWGHQELFDLDEDGRARCVAGVPPDYFSKTGQRWGNPIYRWGIMSGDGYAWWIGRFRHALRCVDTVRIDHFRGFVGYWQIPADEETAVNGEWKPGPGRDFLGVLCGEFARNRDGHLPFIAEDLGILTDDVTETMDEFGLPGMKVLHFAFGEGMPGNPYAPHNHVRNSVVYVGTHDNNTTLGWWSEDATDEERFNFLRYIEKPILPEKQIPDEMIRMALSSTADLAVITAQDVLGQGSEARMNTPSTTVGNWQWRLVDYDGLKARAEQIKKLGVMYGRYPEPPREERATGPDADFLVYR